MTPALSRHAAIWFMFVLSGCTLGPAYQRPALELPDAFRATAQSGAQAWPSPDWWAGFGDPALTGLIEDAIAHNQDIAAAAARVAQADAQVRVAGAPLLPSLGGTADANWQQTAFRGLTANSRQYSVGLNVSYEVDFWGRNRASLQGAQALALSNRFDQQTVALTTVTSVATTWLTALALADRLAVAQRNLAIAENVLAAINGRLAVGTATALDVSQQEALVAGQRAVIPGLRNQLEQQVIGLGILTGHPPESITLRPDTLDRVSFPPVAPGLTSDLLARRPDIAAAEALLVSQNANIRIARAAFFPTIQLTGSGGLQTAALNSLFSPGAVIASLAAGLTQSIFDNGLNQGNLEQARARNDELVANYRQVVLQAFTDVENALTAVRFTEQQEALEAQAVAVARRSAQIAQAQMAAGTIDIVTALNVQQTLFNDLDALAQIRQSRAAAVVNLYKALGGGWTLPAGGDIYQP